jgi:nitrogen fixation/metabolism regulation signal transduction histidine kinase
MEHRTLTDRITSPVTAVALSAVLLVALYLLVETALQNVSSGQVYYWVLVVNIIGIILLLCLLLINLARLTNQYRAGFLGSRLTVRLFTTFVLLTLIPLLSVYYISVQFLSKGVDSWFDVRVEQAVDDALLLGKTTLEAMKQDVIEQVDDHAQLLSEAYDRNDLIRSLDEIRAGAGYRELSLYTQNGSIIAFSNDDARVLLPDAPDDNVMSQIRLGQVYAALEPVSEDSQQLRVVSPVYSKVLGRAIRALQAIKPLPLRYSKLAGSVESASNQYEQMVFSRGPLRFSLILTLSLISLITLLLSVLGAIYLSRRIVAPLGDLAEGTRAVATGNYSTELPVTSSDELGILVGSFNDMTREIRKAQDSAQASQVETETQRGYLETVLARLSSGVLSFDPERILRTYNRAAEEILGLGLENQHETGLASLEQNNETLSPFFKSIQAAMDEQRPEWQEELVLLGQRGRQILIVRGSALSTDTRRGGYVVVFDDVTDLIQAQRDAAWGEVARRLAPEIKNPLTPIQLSAERIRHKFLDQVEQDQRNSLDRATRTIVQQVESIKEMVNSFSTYAQPVRTELSMVDLNRLVRDVGELYLRDDEPVVINFELDDELPMINANPNALRQVLNNLLINARHALEGANNPEITVETGPAGYATGHYVDLRIHDNGSGIPEEFRESLFDPYVSSKSKGTGLGLAIVKRIVEEHGGTVWAENRVDGGATLTVRLPVPSPESRRSPYRWPPSGEKTSARGLG